jgi:hypothetical protein
MRNRKYYRRGPNPAEHSFEELAAQQQIELVRRGYPDYLIIQNDDIVGFVEVKPRLNKPLKDHQERFKRFCQRYGVPFFRWSPEEPFPSLK